MKIDTDPSELFREVRDMDGLLLDLVAVPDRVEWHWPSFYLLYVELDRMSWRLQNAEGIFREPGMDKRDANVEGANACLHALGQGVLAVAGQLWQISRGVLSRVRDVNLRLRLQAHLHPKSSWYQTLRTDYQAGTFSADGGYLERTILLLEPDTVERIDSPHEQFLLLHQKFHLADEHVMAQLLTATRETAELHAQVLRAFSTHFVAHCRIENLLHPSSL